MRQFFMFLLVSGSLFIPSALLSDENSQGKKAIGIAPAAGVELEEIKIVRWTSRDAVLGADLTNMELKLWFPATWKKEEKNFHFLFHLQSLGQIEDDTGKMLSTDERLRRIEYLRGEVQMDEYKAGGRSAGPFARFLIEAPSRRAEKIKSIKGKAVLSLAKEVTLTFNDLAAINGKELDHPEMKGLRALKLGFSIEEKGGKVSAKVTAPFNYASPWNRGRLHSWDLVDAKDEISFSSEAVSPHMEGVAVEKTYDCRSFKGLSLRLILLEPVETKTFSFDFKNVPLP